MRTTIDIPDDLAIQAKKVAAEHRTTLRALVVRGLRSVISTPGTTAPPDPIDRLAGLGSDIWEGVDPAAYVDAQRKGWE